MGVSPDDSYWSTYHQPTTNHLGVGKSLWKVKTIMVVQSHCRIHFCLATILNHEFVVTPQVRLQVTPNIARSRLLQWVFAVVDPQRRILDGETSKFTLVRGQWDSFAP